jgi:hypothetical protein
MAVMASRSVTKYRSMRMAAGMRSDLKRRFPFLKSCGYVAGTLRKRGKLDTSAARFIAPDHLATAVNVSFCFRQIEAQGYGPVHFQRFTGLDSEAVFVPIEQFAQIHNHAGPRAIETDVNGSMKFLTNATAPLPQSANAPIHSCPPY